MYPVERPSWSQVVSWDHPEGSATVPFFMMHFAVVISFWVRPSYVVSSQWDCAINSRLVDIIGFLHGYFYDLYMLWITETIMGLNCITGSKFSPKWTHFFTEPRWSGLGGDCVQDWEIVIHRKSWLDKLIRITMSLKARVCQVAEHFLRKTSIRSHGMVSTARCGDIWFSVWDKIFINHGIFVIHHPGLVSM